MQTNTTLQRIPLAALEARVEWQALTLKQQTFLRAYIQSGVDTGTYDAVAAVRAAYNATGNAKVLSYELLANPKIDRILVLHFGWNEQDRLKTRHQKSVKQLLRQVRFQLRHAEPGSVSAQRLTAQLQSLLLNQEPPVEREPEAETAVSNTRIPVGATALVDERGVTRGYRTADGQYVQLAAVEATR
jgi:hypothetical protein